MKQEQEDATIIIFFMEIQKISSQSVQIKRYSSLVSKMHSIYRMHNTYKG